MKVSKLPYRRVTREEMTDGLQRVIERVKAAQSVEEILAQGVPKAVILYKSNAIKKLIDEQMQRLASGQLTEEEELEATTLINTLNCEKTNISHKVQRTIL